MFKKLFLESSFSLFFKISISVVLGFVLFLFPFQYFVKLFAIVIGIFYLRRVGFYG